MPCPSSEGQACDDGRRPTTAEHLAIPVEEAGLLGTAGGLGFDRVADFWLLGGALVVDRPANACQCGSTSDNRVNGAAVNSVLHSEAASQGGRLE